MLNQRRTFLAGINLNPYQGLKLSVVYRTGDNFILCRNQPKSLSGIETTQRLILSSSKRAGINLNPYQGLKQDKVAQFELR